MQESAKGSTMFELHEKKEHDDENLNENLYRLFADVHAEIFPTSSLHTFRDSSVTTLRFFPSKLFSRFNFFFYVQGAIHSGF